MSLMGTKNNVLLHKTLRDVSHKMFALLRIGYEIFVSTVPGAVFTNNLTQMLHCFVTFMSEYLKNY